MWAKWLHNPRRLAGPQRSTRGGNNKTLHGDQCSRGPHVGESGYIAHAVSGVPNAHRGETITRRYVAINLQGAQMFAQSRYITPAVSGVPTLRAGGGGVRKHHVTMNGRAGVGHKCGRSGYITPAVSGVHNVERTNKIRTHGVTIIVQGAHMWGQGGYIIPTLSGGPNA